MQSNAFKLQTRSASHLRLLGIALLVLVPLGRLTQVRTSAQPRRGHRCLYTEYSSLLPDFPGGKEASTPAPP